VRFRLASVALVVGTSFLALLGCASCDQSLANENLRRGTFDNVGTATAPLRLWVEERGRGEPILMLHGFGATMYTWRYVAPALAHTHRVVTVDLKGSGRSDKPFDDGYRVLDQVALLKRLIDHRGLTDLTLVGHSFGGGVALALALDLNQTRPAALKRLILIDSIAYQQRLPLFIQLLQAPVVAQIGMYAVLPEIESYEGLYAAYHDPNKITLGAVRAYALPLYQPGGRYALLKTAEEIIPANLSALIERYPTIHQPAQLIWCAEDPIVPLWVGRKLARHLPDAHLSVLRSCGHAPQEELPLQTLRLMRKFLR
jgi:pimeloyl-ACP methyl ester carboxylesterase